MVDLWTLTREGMRYSSPGLSFLGASEENVGDWALPVGWEEVKDKGF